MVHEIISGIQINFWYPRKRVFRQCRQKEKDMGYKALCVIKEAKGTLDKPKENLADIAARPLISKNKVNAAVGLAIWHKEALDCGQYPGYVAGLPTNRRSKKWMKEWLQELVFNDYMVEAQIRNLIRLYVRKWAHVTNWDREVLAYSSKYGKHYRRKIDMPIAPVFDFFFAQRREISQILDKTYEPGNTMDGKERKYVRYL